MDRGEGQEGAMIYLANFDVDDFLPDMTGGSRITWQRLDQKTF